MGDFFIELDILLSKQAIFQMFILINIQKSKLTQMKKTLNMQNVVIVSLFLTTIMISIIKKRF